MTVLATELAPAKINLCLYLGPTRPDGRHELVTVFDSLSFGDQLTVSASAAGQGDEVVCVEVPGPNLVSAALHALRAAGWSAPPVRVEITKRIPIAAGMGGGSADAAAMLRLAPRLAAIGNGVLAEIATALGADVPGQLRPGISLATGAGEVLEPLTALDPYGVLVLPQPFPLSTADVYREADHLGLGRPAAELHELRATVRASAHGALPASLAVNDLQDAALSLAPRIADALAAAQGAGADRAMVCGSGPTVIGLFTGSDGPARAQRAVAVVAGAYPEARAVTQMAAGAGAPAAN